MLGKGSVAAVVVLALSGCALPVGLDEDRYNADKYDLPPVLHLDSTKVLSTDQGEAWAFFSVEEGLYYEVRALGNPSATLSLYRADKTTAYVANAGVDTARGFFAAETGKVFVRIVLAGSEGEYSVDYTRFPVLTPGVWQDDKIQDDGTRWYAFPVARGTSYDFRLLSGDSPIGSKTASVGFGVFNQGRTGDIPCEGPGTDDYPATFVPTADGTIFVQVMAGFGGAGTFAVQIAPTAPPAVLALGVWQDNTLVNGSARWYSLPVVSGRLYDFNMNSYGFGDGDGSKTATTDATIYHADRSSVYANSVSNAFDSPFTFLATSDEIVLVKVTCWGSSGSFAVRMRETPITALSVGVWRNDSLTSFEKRWYSVPVVAGTLYGLKMNNTTSGDGTKTAATTAVVSSSDLTKTYVLSGAAVYVNPARFVAATSGTAYVTVTSHSSFAGTFGVVLEATPVTPLSAGVWQNGTVGASGPVWYSFNADGTSSYTFRPNTKYEGDGTMTGYTEMSIYSGDLLYSYPTGSYNSPSTFTPPAGKVYIRVLPGFGGGTFALLYQ